MVLKDILSTEACETLEAELYARYGINGAVFDRSGIKLTDIPHWCNRLCPQIKASPDALAAICAPGNHHFMARARQTRRPVVGECDAGFIKIAVPICHQGRFLGTAGGCGLLPRGGSVETFLIAKTIGLSERRIHGLCAGVGTMSPKTADNMVAFIQRRLARYA